MSRYAAYGFRTMMSALKGDMVYLGASDDRDYALKISSESKYRFFGVFDFKTDQWILT